MSARAGRLASKVPRDTPDFRHNSQEPDAADPFTTPGTPDAGTLLQLQRTHGNRYVRRVIAELRDQPAPAVQRKEVQKDSDIQGPQDWTTADREGNSQRWQDACLRNLNAVDSSQYLRIVERRDFYKWFYEYTAKLGYTTRWALAARLVADGAHQIADMDEEHAVANDTLDMANVELQGTMREGNQLIFNNVLPKLKKLLDGGPLKGQAAYDWDKQVLAEEQNLVQPLYSMMAPDTVKQIDYIARKKRFAGIGAWWSDGDKVPAGPYNQKGTIPAFDQGDITNINDRWKYGMKLGDSFAPGGTGFDPNKDTMPAVDASYQNQTKKDASGRDVATNQQFEAQQKTQAPSGALHKLDAWLNPNRYSRTGPGSDLQQIISGLTPFDKRVVLIDRSADGWAYSKQFAQFSFITEDQVKQALPNDPAMAGLVAFFLTRYRAERQHVENTTPDMTIMGGF